MLQFLLDSCAAPLISVGSAYIHHGLKYPDTREILFNVPSLCERTGMLQLQGCKPNEMCFKDSECKLNIKCSQKCRYEELH